MGALIFAIVFIIIIISLQFYSFNKTKKAIYNLFNFFPSIATCVKKVNCSFVPSDLDETNVKNFLNSLPPETIEETNARGEIYETVALLSIDAQTRNKHPYFALVIDQTNLYLCKNVGTSADLSILKDICNDRLNTLEDTIQNSLNVPLYLGLAGTFMGIIVGLFGINIQEIMTENGNLGSIQDLLIGIVVAMTASLIGLIFTVKNSSLSMGRIPSFKDAEKNAEDGQNMYFDFLRRELMPVLAHSMASSLNSLRSVLGHFVDKFGSKLDDYANTAELLNDNLDKQQEVLTSIQRIGLSETATKTAQIFLSLKESAESLNIFYNYQQMLNQTISNVTSAVQNIQTLISRFDSFEKGLIAVVNGQTQASQLQAQFQHSIETHFPTGAEAREIWRKEFDLLTSDARDISKQLSTQLSFSSQYIKNFVDNNAQFFDTFNHLKEVVDKFSTYASQQAGIYDSLKCEIFGMRSDFQRAQKESAQTNLSILEAIKVMTSILKSIK